MGRLVIESAPASMMRMAMTHAKTGRSMKNLDIGNFFEWPGLVRGGGSCRWRRWRRRGFNRRAWADALEVAHDDLIARLQARSDQPLIPDRARSLEHAQFDCAICAHDQRRRLLLRVVGSRDTPNTG